MWGVGFKVSRFGRAWRVAAMVLALSASACATPAAPADPPPPPDPPPGRITDHGFTTSDGVRLHYLEAGPARAPTIVLVPGWAMPAWIFRPQITAFASHWHVIALDPRGQGESDVPATGYDPTRRGRDIGELIAATAKQPVLLLGWSLGVLDSLAYVHGAGDAHIAGLVLVDNSIGEEPAPRPRPRPRAPTSPPRPVPYDVRMAAFVRAMFRTPQTEDYLRELTRAALHLPEFASRRLLAYPVPRSYWKEAVYSTQRPVLYIVRPGLAAQAHNLELHHPAAEIAVFNDAGHALFVDEATRFNTLVADFAQRRVWPESPK